MDKQFYIRFGLHRDRNMLRFLKDDYAGIVLPAHILAYSATATIAALRYIDKPYFIDPMTYIYADGYLDGYKVFKKADQKDHLKPSIIKLTNDLSLTEYFPEIGAKPLKTSDFTDDFIAKLAKGNIDLQLNRVNNGLLSSTPKLDTLLASIGQPPAPSSTTYPPPSFITAPYFLIPEKDGEDWLQINLKLARETKRLAPKGSEVRTIVLTYINMLDADLLTAYSEFDGIITWIEDLEEGKNVSSKDQIRKLILYKDFVKLAKAKNVRISNLYGSFYSAILIKLGLEAFCNGPLYGEYKSSAASLGGIPPVRVYMPSIHRFYIYSQANELLRLHPDLYNAFPEKSKAVFKSIPELAKILGDVTLAQEHFINSRNQELTNISEADLSTIVHELKAAFASVGPFKEKPLQHKEPNQLVAWHKALETELIKTL